MSDSAPFFPSIIAGCLRAKEQRRTTFPVVLELTIDQMRAFEMAAHNLVRGNPITESDKDLVDGIALIIGIHAEGLVGEERRKAFLDRVNAPGFGLIG
jgi:hypothetical protein